MLEAMARGAGVLACALALVLVPVARADAQTESATRGGPPWGIFDAIGFGGLGFGLGVIAGLGMEGDDFGPSDGALVLIGAGTVAGILGGAMIGNRARRARALGQPISAGHRTAVAAGVILAGATLGAIAAVPLINPEGEGTPLGSDEQTFGLLVGAGAALGILYLTAQWDHLDSSAVDVAPAVRDGGYGLIVRVRL